MCASLSDRRHPSLLMVDMHEQSHVGEPDSKMGNHAQLTADIQFVNVFVRDDSCAWHTGQGLRAALGCWARSHGHWALG